MGWVVDKVTDAVEDIGDIVKGLWDSTVSFGEFLVTLDFDDLQESIKILFRDVVAPVLKPIFNFLGIEDETVVSVETVTLPLLTTEAKYFKNILYNGIKENADLAEQIRFAIITGQRANIRSFLNYGKNHYIDGIPLTEVSEYFTDTEVVKNILDTESGESITIHSAEFSNPDTDLWCKDYLMDNNSYVIETNTLVWNYSNWQYESAALNIAEDAFIVNLTREVTTTVIIDSYTQVLIDTIEYTDTWTRTTTEIDTGTPSEFQTSYVDTDYVRTPTSTGGPYVTTFVNVSSVATPTTQSIASDIEVSIYDPGGYYGVVYSLDSAPSIKLIWFYSVELGTYPELDNSLIGGGVDNLDTLPIVALREEFVNVDSDKESQRYKTTKRILSILNLVELDPLLEALNENPDIGLIQDAYLVLGVNLYNEDQYSLRYLFNFFMMISVLPKFDKTAFLALSELDKSNSNFIYKVTEGRYNTALSGNYIEITEFTGYIGKVGYVETEFDIQPNTEATIENLEDRTNTSTQDSNDSLGLINSIFYIRTQLTESTYIEVEVSGLLLTTYILALGEKVSIKVIELVDPVTGDSNAKSNFIIPLSYYLLYRTSPIECEQIIYDAVHLVAYAEQVTELEYYQTSAFIDLVSLIIDIVAIVILIVSLGNPAGVGVSQALWIIARQLIIQYGLALALEEILSHNLSDTEKAVAILLYVFAAKKGAEIIDPDALILLADELLLTINSVVTFIQVDTAQKTEDLLIEQREFQSLLTEQKEELELAEEWLNPDASIDTFNLLNSRVIPVLDTTSTPQEFYDRSLLVNVAPIILSQPSNYVATALDLNNIEPIANRPIGSGIDTILKLL